MVFSVLLFLIVKEDGDDDVMIIKFKVFVVIGLLRMRLLRLVRKLMGGVG